MCNRFARFFLENGGKPLRTHYGLRPRTGGFVQRKETTNCPAIVIPPIGIGAFA
jgi:hypothetical protein